MKRLLHLLWFESDGSSWKGTTGSMRSAVRAVQQGLLHLLGVESSGPIPLGRIPPVRRDRNKEEVRLQRTKGAVARINLIGNKESTYAEEERERDNNGS